jgi:hypothetical protein
LAVVVAVASAMEVPPYSPVALAHMAAMVVKAVEILLVKMGKHLAVAVAPPAFLGALAALAGAVNAAFTFGNDHHELRNHQLHWPCR